MAALSEIEKLEARFNENPDGRFFAPLADAYRKAGRLDDALVMVTSNLTKHPDYLSAHIVLGRCLLDKKDDTAAQGAFQRVLELDSENIIALKSLAEISERVGRTDEARGWLTRLLAVDQMNAEAEEDLRRLGGPLAEAAAAAPAEVDSETRVSFADLAEPEPAAAPPPPEELPTLPVPALDIPAVPKTLERPAVRADVFRMAEDKTAEFTPTPFETFTPPPAVEEPASAPLMDLEPTGFVPPTEPVAEPALQGSDIVPFDDQLAWDAGDRQSHAIRQEDIVEAEKHHEATAAAIDFLETTAPPAHPEPPAAAAAPGSTDAADASATHSGEHTVSFDEHRDEPAAAGPEPAESADATGLPLIMPEDVTPEAELRRPSAKQVKLVSPEEPAPVEGGGEPLLTETMAELYLRQGMRAEAADVYRRLLSKRPDDAALKAKLAAIESPPANSASALGTEAVGAWLRRVARSPLPTAPAAAPAPPEPGPTPMEAAFAEPVREAPAPAPAEPAADAAPGEPARPASTAFSLDQIFGGPGAGGEAAPPRAHGLGASFDEFFGGAAAPDDTVRPGDGDAAKPSEDDLSAFTAWLHGLKR